MIGFYGISTFIGYLIPVTVYTYINICGLLTSLMDFYSMQTRLGPRSVKRLGSEPNNMIALCLIGIHHILWYNLVSQDGLWDVFVTLRLKRWAAE